MKPTRARNTKARPDLRSPTPGLNTRKASRPGKAVAARFSDNRPGSRGKRNKDNSVRDRNLGSVDSSGRKVEKFPHGKRRSTSLKVANPQRFHKTSDTRADSKREAHRRRKQIRRIAKPARRQKQTAKFSRNT